MKKKNTFLTKIENDFEDDRKSLGHFFLGAGLIMFLLNITTILNFIYVSGVSYPLTGYVVSIVSSLFLMGYAGFNIFGIK